MAVTERSLRGKQADATADAAAAFRAGRGGWGWEQRGFFFCMQGGAFEGEDGRWARDAVGSASGVFKRDTSSTGRTMSSEIERARNLRRAVMASVSPRQSVIIIALAIARMTTEGARGACVHVGAGRATVTAMNEARKAHAAALKELGGELPVEVGVVLVDPASVAAEVQDLGPGYVMHNKVRETKKARRERQKKEAREAQQVGHVARKVLA